MSPAPVVALDRVELIPRPEAWRPTGATAERFDASRATLGPVLGLTKIGCNVTQVANTGSAPLRYLAVSTLIDPEVCEYPDSGKVGTCAGNDADGLMHLSRYADPVDYGKDE